ncbi:MAG: ribosome silencing factor [Acidobacteriota bacterium]
MNDSIESRVRVAVAAALDKKAFDLDVLQVGAVTSIADYFILASATNERQTVAISDSIESQLKEQLGVRALVIEGATPGRWVLMDFGDFIVHIFTEDVRRFYGLERLWGDAPNVTAEYVGEAEPRAFQKTS